MLARNLSQNRFHILAEAHVQHLVRFIQNDHFQVVQTDRMASHMIHHASRCADDDLHAAF